MDEEFLVPVFPNRNPTSDIDSNYDLESLPDTDFDFNAASLASETEFDAVLNAGEPAIAYSPSGDLVLSSTSDLNTGEPASVPSANSNHGAYRKADK